MYPFSDRNAGSLNQVRGSLSYDDDDDDDDDDWDEDIKKAIGFWLAK